MIGGVIVNVIVNGCIVLKKVYRFILSDTLMTGDVEPS